MNEPFNEIVKKDLITALKGVISALKKQDSEKIKEISTHTVHNASTFQDHYSISFAVVMYSLSKIMWDVKLKEGGTKARVFFEKVSNSLDKMLLSLKTGDLNNYEDYQRKILDLVSDYDKNYSKYIKLVLEKAKIKKATHIYEHGISLGRVAELLGITKWEIMDYLGATKVHEPEDTVPKPVHSRLKIANKLFGKEESK